VPGDERTKFPHGYFVENCRETGLACTVVKWHPVRSVFVDQPHMQIPTEGGCISARNLRGSSACDSPDRLSNKRAFIVITMTRLLVVPVYQVNYHVSAQIL
jgi:hypothetical protein